MPSPKPSKRSSNRGGSKKRRTSRHAPARVSIAAGRDIRCADFIGRDQHITYGFTPKDVERLIDKVLAFWQAGAEFVRPAEGDEVRAEANGETLVFRPGAIQKLARRRNEKSYLLSLTLHQDYRVWATKFIPLAAQMDVKRAVEGLDMPVAFSEFRIPREGEDRSSGGLS